MRKKKEIGLEEMTLKDFIAIFAMQGILADPNTPEIMDIASAAYEVAEAMMEARNGN
jgi:phosphotransacetylase